MQIASIFKNLIPSPVKGRMFYMRGTKGIPDVNQDNALGLPTVLSCTRVIAESVASLGIAPYSRTERGGAKATEHPLYEKIRWAPNPEWSSYDWRLWMQIDCIIRGNSYSQILRDEEGRVSEIWPLQASKCKPLRKEGSGELVYTYPYAGPDGKQQTAVLSARDVLHIKDFSDGGLVSPSMVDLSKDALGQAKAAEEYAGEFFANGTQVSGVLTASGELSDDAYRRLKESWDSTHGARGGRHKTPLLEGGTEFKPLQLNNRESQMIEARKFSRSMIAGIMRVPAHLINDLEKATFSNIVEMDIGFVKHSLRPRLVNIEQRMRMALLTDEERAEGMYFRHSVNDLLRGDFKSRMEGYAIARQNGWMSANDILSKEDEQTYEGGDVHLVNGNMITVERAASNTEGTE